MIGFYGKRSKILSQLMVNLLNFLGIENMNLYI